MRCVRSVLLGFFLGVAVTAGIGLLEAGGVIDLFNVRSEWAIGIYKSEPSKPLNFSGEGIRNPVLTSDDVRDAPATSVVDPFLVRHNDKWYLFFELVNRDFSHGDIGLAVSDNGLDWSYDRVVLDEPYHLSYPYVFEGGVSII